MKLKLTFVTAIQMLLAFTLCAVNVDEKVLPGEVTKQFNDTLQKARELNRPVIVQVNSTWCGWCKRQSSYLKENSELRDIIRDNYLYVELIRTKENRQEMEKFLPPVTCYPYTFVVDTNGKYLGRFVGAFEYGDGLKQDIINYRNMLNNWKDLDQKIEKLRKRVNVELAPVAAPAKLNSGVESKLYEGKWEILPKFSKLTPKETTVLTSISADHYNSKEFIGVNFTGYFYIEKPGAYNIRLTSNDGSRLRINGKMIIDNDGMHQLKDCYIQLNLKRGYYPIELDYFRNGGNYGLIFSFNHAEDRTVEPKLFYVSKEK